MLTPDFPDVVTVRYADGPSMTERAVRGNLSRSGARATARTVHQLTHVSDDWTLLAPAGTDIPGHAEVEDTTGRRFVVVDLPATRRSGLHGWAPAYVAVGLAYAADREIVTVLTGTPAIDPYSKEPDGLDWDDPIEVDVETLLPCEPRPVGEVVQHDRNAVTGGWTVYLPPGTDVTADSRLRIRGVEYPVLGEPAVWPLGVIVQTERTEG